LPPELAVASVGPAPQVPPRPVPRDEFALPLPEPGEKDVVVIAIHLGVGNGWRLDIQSDGTTRLGYGAADTWLGEPNNFDFPATLKPPRPVARKKDFPGGRHSRVGFVTEVGRTPTQGYPQDEKLILGLFNKAVQGLHHRNERFDEI